MIRAIAPATNAWTPDFDLYLVPPSMFVWDLQEAAGAAPPLSVLEKDCLGHGRAPSAHFEIEVIAKILRAECQANTMAVFGLIVGIGFDLKVIVGPVHITEKEARVLRHALNKLALLETPISAAAELRLAIHHRAAVGLRSLR
jgi:hypothetical protein